MKVPCNQKHTQRFLRSNPPYAMTEHSSSCSAGACSCGKASSAKLTAVLIGAALILTAFSVSHLRAPALQAESLKGAWVLQYPEQAHQTVLLFTGKHFSVTAFDTASRRFIHTYGGTWEVGQDSITKRIEFHTANPKLVGSTERSALYLPSVGQMRISLPDGRLETWSQTDKGGPMNACWRITGRAAQDGTMSEIRPGPRKTIKILTGNRFQWAAINTETKEFFGTGGGTFTVQNGKYTEHIEFFSRDSTRVGAALTFDIRVEGSKWHHSGLSSKGDPIAEVWTKED